MPGHEIAKIRLCDSEATSWLGANLAPLLVPGDTLLLSGQLGSGKTHFARALIQERLSLHGLFEEVPSPTFAIVQIYETPDTEIWHADLYRLSSSEEAVELGISEAFDEAIVLIEWPDRLGNSAPSDALWIDFDVIQDKRLIRMSSNDLAWLDRLDLESHADG